jgi:D-serine deaminase-like pyridoxal phosphate-dependent protein
MTSNQIMLGIPLPLDRIAELAQVADTLQKHDGHVRILIDHPRQLSFLEEWTKQEAKHRRWSVFVKCDAGGK